MPSVYSRILFYQKKHKRKPLTQTQKEELGKLICMLYFVQQVVTGSLHKIISKEPEGEFTVLSYPKKFIPFMDEMIISYWDSMAAIPKRKRVPTKIISVKPSNPNRD